MTRVNQAITRAGMGAAGSVIAAPERAMDMRV
jgi:hypothetical protein